MVGERNEILHLLATWTGVSDGSGHSAKLRSLPVKQRNWSLCPCGTETVKSLAELHKGAGSDYRENCSRMIVTILHLEGYHPYKQRMSHEPLGAHCELRITIFFTNGLYLTRNRLQNRLPKPPCPLGDFRVIKFLWSQINRAGPCSVANCRPDCGGLPASNRTRRKICHQDLKCKCYKNLPNQAFQLLIALTSFGYAPALPSSSRMELQGALRNCLRSNVCTSSLPSAFSLMVMRS